MVTKLGFYSVARHACGAQQLCSLTAVNCQKINGIKVLRRRVKFLLVYELNHTVRRCTDTCIQDP